MDSVFINGKEYSEVWLNGVKISDIDGGGQGGGDEELVYPYDDADSVITYINTSSSTEKLKFTVIDSSLPYSINGTSTKEYSISAGKFATLKLVNLKLYPTFYVFEIKQLRIPNLTDLSNLFENFGYGTWDDTDRYYLWSPQYFEFHPNPTNMSNMFKQAGSNSYHFKDEIMAQFMPYFPNTSSVTNMSGMFYHCSKLTNLDLSFFDTHNVTNMDNIFYYCNGLIELDISNWDFSNLTSKKNMFYSCDKLVTLKAHNLILPSDCSNFLGISSVITIDGLNTWDTHNVTNMSSLFSSKSKLTSVDVSNWNTSNVTNMRSVFSYCSSLTEIKGLNTWDTSKVTNMNSMFYKCSKLKELDLSSFDTSNVTDFQSMFSSVKDCTIYVNENKWTLGTDSSLGGGTNLKFVVVDDNGNVVPRPTDLLLDFTQPTMPIQLPVWIDEVARNANYYFKHGTYKYDSTVYGLVENVYSSYENTYWNCYKVVAPSNIMKITFRAYPYGTNYPFTIHLTSDATQPSYSSSTNRLISVTDSITYRTKDGVVETEVVAGETYYIHFQHRRYGTDYSYSTCIRSIEFLPPIESIDLSYDVDLDNVEQQVFTVSPIIEPTNYDVKDLEIIYDSNYMSVNPTTFEIALIDGCQGMSHTVTYRSKTDNSISKSITFYVNENLEISMLIDFTQETAPVLPVWFTEETKGSSYYFRHGTFKYDSTIYGLVDNTSGQEDKAWSCYKLVAPITGTISFTYRVNAYTNNDSYPFTIHATTSTNKPSYNSPTNRIACVFGRTYRDEDGITTLNVTQGETYYIHFQFYRGYDVSAYGTCIRSIELIPSEE